jgi:hypothetical protein
VFSPGSGNPGLGFYVSTSTAGKIRMTIV